MGHLKEVPKFKNSMCKNVNFLTCKNFILLVPSVLVSNAHTSIPGKFSFFAPGGKMPFFRNLDKGKRFSQNFKTDP